MESYVTSRPDTWRCFVGRYIIDPCFGGGKGWNVMVCARSPWHRSGILIRGRGFETFGAQIKRAWAIKTSEGHRCTWLSGASNFRDGRRLNYGCWPRSNASPTGGDGYLWGTPKRRNGRLMIPYSTDYNTPWRWVRVVERWN